MSADAPQSGPREPSATSVPELSSDEWVALKALWEACEELSAERRTARLADPAVAPAVRRTLEELFALEESAGEALERPAHERLGLTSPISSNAIAPATMVGRRLGPFKVLQLVGRGGMGAVYEAERADLAYRQRVAIKTLWRGADSDVLMQRFRSERQILAALQHPNIAQLIDGGSTEEGTPWLAMEFVEGTPIDVWCDARALDIPARLDLFRQVCAAVQHAHQRLVVHRDLKPSNVLVSTDGVVKLLDFGVAKLMAPTDADGTLTGAGLSPLTAAYAAPEQLDDTPLSTATDIYALGAILTLLLAGEPPRDVTGLSSPERLLAIREGTPRAPSAIAAVAPMSQVTARRLPSPAKLAGALRGELDAIAQMALRREPARRYASAEALSDDVHRFLRRDRVRARLDSTGYRVWSFVRRRRVLTAAVSSVFVTIVVAGVVAWTQARAATAEARRAERATTFLSGLVTGSNATSYDPLVRLAPNGTLAQLLDSALTRIPREFADDPRIRARLYTAIGANLVTQGREDRALVVLDSARRLATRGYGASSPDFARASLEWAATEMAFTGPAAIDRALAEAERIAAAYPKDTELKARLDLVRASQAMALGRVQLADSLATRVIAGERARQRTMLSLRAEAARMYASSWIRRDPRDYLRRARAVRRLGDSLGMSGTTEQLTAMNAEFEALAVLGRTDEAARSMDAMRANTDPLSASSPRAQLSSAMQRAYLAGIGQDTRERSTQVARALALVEQGTVVTQNQRLLVYNTSIDESLSRGDTAAARRLARRSVQELEPSGSPMILGFAYWYLGRAELAAQDAVAALAAVEVGRRWIDRAPDLTSVLPLLQRVQVQALTQLGRVAEAERLGATPRPTGAVPACTPGGNWKGCPDLPP